VPTGTTGAPVLGPAGPGRPEIPNEGRKIREMGDRDLYGGGQVLEAIRLDDPRRVIAEDPSNPSLLGTGEHGAAMVAERAEVGQPPPAPCRVSGGPVQDRELEVRMRPAAVPCQTAESGRRAMVTVGAAPPLWLSA
jgi:hypothetical protein